MKKLNDMFNPNKKYKHFVEFEKQTKDQFEAELSKAMAETKGVYDEEKSKRKATLDDTQRKRAAIKDQIKALNDKLGVISKEHHDASKHVADLELKQSQLLSN